jgi:hypothetical protein
MLNAIVKTFLANSSKLKRTDKLERTAPKRQNFQAEATEVARKEVRCVRTARAANRLR